MSFSIQTVQAEASDIQTQVTAAAGHDREKAVLDALEKAIGEIAEAIGGYLSVSCSGHINEQADQLGDTVSLSIGSVLRPNAPTPDAGSTAAISSTAANPPDAVTAAPQTADGAPPATQGGPGLGQVSTSLGDTTSTGVSAPPAPEQPVIGNASEDAQQAQVDYTTTPVADAAATADASSTDTSGTAPAPETAPTAAEGLDTPASDTATNDPGVTASGVTDGGWQPPTPPEEAAATTPSLTESDAAGSTSTETGSTPVSE